MTELGDKKKYILQVNFIYVLYTIKINIFVSRLKKQIDSVVLIVRNNAWHERQGVQALPSGVFLSLSSLFPFSYCTYQSWCYNMQTPITIETQTSTLTFYFSYETHFFLLHKLTFIMIKREEKQYICR